MTGGGGGNLHDLQFSIKFISRFYVVPIKNLCRSARKLSYAVDSVLLLLLRRRLESSRDEEYENVPFPFIALE